MPVVSYLIRRIVQAIFVVFVVTLLVAFAIRLTGDPAVMMMGDSANVSEADLAFIRESLGLNRPFFVQYWDFMVNLFTGELGNSFYRGAISPLLASAMKATLILSVCAIIFSFSMSLPLGIYAARNRGKWGDQLIRIISLTGLSFPNFWLGIMLMLLFAVTLKWLPVSGFTEWKSVILPAVTIGLVLMASNLRIIRSAMLEVLSSQYIMVARSKGLSERSVVYKHALRNAAITIITYLGIQFGKIVGGIVVVEKVFDWPGLGTLAIDAIGQRDYPVLQVVISVVAIMIVLVNLLVDLAYVLLDPRIRLE